MNKLWFVLTAGLLLVVVFLASRLVEAERKLAALEARPSPTRVRMVPSPTTVENGTASSAVVPETGKAAEVEKSTDISPSNAVAEHEPSRSNRSTRRDGERTLDSGPRQPVAPQVEFSGLTVLIEPPMDVEHWQGGAKRNWGHEQAAGEPDTTQPGDIQSAWASKKPDGGEEWIQLDYDRAVDLKQVSVVESHNPGAISKVVAVLPDGSESPIWEGTMDPSAGDELVSSDFMVGSRVRAQSVKVYLDTSRVPGWNEIDAVQLIGRDGSKQWATASRASSSYPDR